MKTFHCGLNKTLKLAEAIKKYIKENSMRGGDRLPSIARFASMFSVGKDSVNDAMALLSYEGIVVIRPRHGVFISGSAWENLYPKSPRWDDLIFKSPQKPNSAEFAYLVKEGAKTRSLSDPNISSRFCPDVLSKGLIGAARTVGSADYCELRDISGYMPLKEALCAYMETYGLFCLPEQVFVMHGIVDALSAVFFTSMHGGMELVYGMPSYIPAKKRLASYGVSMTGVPMDAEGISKDRFMSCLIDSSKRKMLYAAPCFSNPTGVTMSMERRKELLTICVNAKTPVIEVDSYRALADNLPRPIASLDNTNSVIYIGILGDILPDCNRLCWLVVPKPLIDRLYVYKSQSDYMTAPYQAMWHSLLETGEYFKYKSWFAGFLKEKRAFTQSVLETYMGDKARWNSDGHPLIYLLELNDPSCVEKIYANNDLMLYKGSEYFPGYENRLVISGMSFTEEEFIEKIKLLRAKLDA